MNLSRPIVPSVVLLALLAGCAAGPDYVRPDAPAPSAYKELEGWTGARPADVIARGAWWQLFGDAQLDALAAQVEVSSQALRVAEAQFRQARAVAQGARAAYFPTLDAGLSVTRSRARAGTTATAHTLTLDASWEADLWGRIRRSVESAEADTQASAADVETLRLSLDAELVQDYLLLRIADAQKRLLDETVAAFERSLELTASRYAGGVAGKVDVVQAQAQLKSTQAQALDVGVQRAQLEHAIAVLIGKAPAELSIAPAPLTPALPALPVGLPSQLLERRPDIAAAERRMASANAQIGVASAAYFPSLVLSASGGYDSDSWAHWLSAPNRFWALGPALAATLFDGRLRRARDAQAVAAFDATVATYRQTVLAGFQEVEDNLATLRILEQEAVLQDEAVAAARESLTLTLNQYKAGVVSYLNVTTAQATTLAAQRSAVDILGRRLAASVQLIRALGGGWHAQNLALQRADDGNVAAGGRP